jgi:aryl-alcohol dehydrogenase-like predicted oxidoreductase
MNANGHSRWDEATRERAREVIGFSRTNSSGIPLRPLGRSGEHVTIIGLGGWHLGAIGDDATAIRIMHAAIDEGVTFFDNAWDYHDGYSEELMGRALQGGKRQQVFLMTKNCERDYEGSMRNLEESLRRLQTDHLDLWQFHEINYDNDPAWVFERGGIRAALEAKQAGKVRFIGFTGHKDPSIHLSMLSRDFEWDTVQMPINVLDHHYRSFLNRVVPWCLERRVAVIGMKGLGGGYPQGEFVEAAGLDALECYRFCLSQPVATQVMGMTSVEQVQANARMAREFKALAMDAQHRFAQQVVEVAGDGRHERFKSGQEHDGPHHRRQHGFAVA